METMKYKIISSEEQYDEYCQILYELDFPEGKKSQETEDEMELLGYLIEKWDNEHYPRPKRDPVEMIRLLMEEHKMKSKDLAELLGVSKGYASEVLNYKKYLSKDSIRILAERFKMRQDAFNQPYELKNAVRKTPKKIIKKKKSKRKTARV